MLHRTEMLCLTAKSSFKRFSINPPTGGNSEASFKWRNVKWKKKNINEKQ